MKKFPSAFRFRRAAAAFSIAASMPLTVSLSASVSASMFAPPLIIAQVPTQVKTGFQYGLGLLFMVGFIWGVINIWGGADRLKKGDADGKMGIVSGIIIAGAAAIMAALFYIFGMSDGALTPQF